MAGRFDLHTYRRFARSQDEIKRAGAFAQWLFNTGAQDDEIADWLEASRAGERYERADGEPSQDAAPAPIGAAAVSSPVSRCSVDCQFCAGSGFEYVTERGERISLTALAQFRARAQTRKCKGAA